MDGTCSVVCSFTGTAATAMVESRIRGSVVSATLCSAISIKNRCTIYAYISHRRSDDDVSS